MAFIDAFFYTERSLEEQMAAGEEIKIRVHQHPIILWKPALWAVLALLLWLYVAFRIPQTGSGMDVFSVLAIGLWLWLGWKEFNRRHSWLVITDKRMLRYEGIVSRSIPMMRLSKVTDLTYERSVTGRVFGYGTIIVESAGQDQALNLLDYLPEPDSVYAMLNGALFGEEPRERSDAPRRPWRRRRRSDTDDSNEGPGNGGGQGPDDGGGGSGGSGDGPGDSGGSGGPPATPVHRPAGGTPDGDSGLTSDPAYEPWGAPDVPPAGYQPRPRRPDVGRVIEVPAWVLYQSADRMAPQSQRDIDTGPIPVSQRRHRTR